MGEMARALKNISKLPANCLIQFPSGRWGFVGSVDIRLAYIRKDGDPLTDKDIKDMSISGPGFCQVKTLSWATKDDAISAASAFGIEVK